MFGQIDKAIAGKIDEITRRWGEQTGTASELKQLSELFGTRYLSDLYEVLAQAFPSIPRMSQEFTIRLAWIDKIPLAKVDGVASKTELGDAVLFAIERFVSPEGMQMGEPRARAVLLQAKVADNPDRIARPLVPVQQMANSTEREYDLLSGWPKFDLYKASRSKGLLATGIDLRGSISGTLGYGWYIVAPRVPANRKPNELPKWESWWMGAPAQLNRCCDVSFGTLLRHFLTGEGLPAAGNLQVGAKFACEVYPPSSVKATGWDRICAEIISLTENADAPKKVFSSRPSRRLVSSKPLPLGFLTDGVNPELGFQRIVEVPSGEDASSLKWRGRRFFERIIGRRRIPVITFESRIVEG